MKFLQVKESKVVAINVEKKLERKLKQGEEHIPQTFKVQLGVKIEMQDGSYWFCKYMRNYVCPKCGEVHKRQDALNNKLSCKKCSTSLDKKPDSWTFHYPRVQAWDKLNRPMFDMHNNPIYVPEQKRTFEHGLELYKYLATKTWGKEMFETLVLSKQVAELDYAAKRKAA